MEKAVFRRPGPGPAFRGGRFAGVGGR